MSSPCHVLTSTCPKLSVPQRVRASQDLVVCHARAYLHRAGTHATQATRRHGDVCLPAQRKHAAGALVARAPLPARAYRPRAHARTHTHTHTHTHTKPPCTQAGVCAQGEALMHRGQRNAWTRGVNARVHRRDARMYRRGRKGLGGGGREGCVCEATRSNGQLLL
jgi:hypothetical protein